jgi:hypothetical protein
MQNGPSQGHEDLVSARCVHAGRTLAHQFAPEGVIVDLHRVPGRRIEPIPRMGDLVTMRGDVGRAFQVPRICSAAMRAW